MAYLAILAAIIGCSRVWLSTLTSNDQATCEAVIVAKDPLPSISPCEQDGKSRKVIADATNSDIQRLKTQSNDGLAVLAAWEEVRRTLPKHDDTITERFVSHAAPVPAMPHFLGFLEGRLRIPLPHQWAAAMRRARAYDRDWLVFLPVPTRAEDSKTPGSGPGFGIVPSIVRDFRKAANGLVIGGDVTVCWDKHRIRLAAAKMATFPGDSWSGLVMDRMCLVAHFPGLIADTCELYCIDYELRKIAWSARVWLGCGRLLGAQGPGSHSVTFVAVKDAVFLFGMANDVAYIEGFSLSDGRSIIRFSTTHMSD
jgi:hypothetical protein